MRRWLPIVFAPLFLAGCAGDWNVEEASMMPDKGDQYARALHKIYVERAQFEKKEGDWRDVEFFTVRARMAADGKPVAPQVAEERGLGGMSDIKAARDRLAAALATTAPQDTPEACAKATAWFEHWMEQVEEGHQKDHIAEAKTNFDAAMPGCKPKMRKSYVIYFDLGKAALTHQAHATLKQVAADYAAIKPEVVNLAGHTDTLGKPAANDKLSAARATNVADALAHMGVSTRINRNWAGEAKLAVPTGDETKELKNRRVEISFEK